MCSEASAYRSEPIRRNVRPDRRLDRLRVEAASEEQRRRLRPCAEPFREGGCALVLGWKRGDRRRRVGGSDAPRLQVGRNRLVAVAPVCERPSPPCGETDVVHVPDPFERLESLGPRIDVDAGPLEPCVELVL